MVKCINYSVLNVGKVLELSCLSRERNIKSLNSKHIKTTWLLSDRGGLNASSCGPKGLF